MYIKNGLKHMINGLKKIILVQNNNISTLILNLQKLRTHATFFILIKLKYKYF